MNPSALCIAIWLASMTASLHAQERVGLRGWFLDTRFGYEMDGEPVIPEGAYAAIYSAKPLWMGFLWKRQPPVRRYTGAEYIAFMRFMTAARDRSRALWADLPTLKEFGGVGVLEVGAANVESQSLDITCTRDKKWYALLIHSDPISSTAKIITNFDGEVAKWLAVPLDGK